jgi:di/tricarboxylate transporter
MDSSLIFLIILCFFTILMVTEIVTADLAALLGLAFIALLGFIEPEEAFSGFASPAVITMVAMFIVALALQRSGVTEALAKQICKIIGKNEKVVILVVMLVGAIISGGMNNVAAVSLLLPPVMLIAKYSEVAPAKLLMPLTFSIILGGTMTLIGSTPNLIIVDIMEANDIEPFKFLSFTPFGLSLTLVGVLFISLGGYKLLPVRKSGSRIARQGTDLTSLYKLSDRIFTLKIPDNSAISGLSIEGSNFGGVFGAQIVSIGRGEQKILYPNPKEKMYSGDILLVQGRQYKIESLLKFNGVKVETLDVQSLNQLRNHIDCYEFRIKSETFSKTTLRDINFRERYNLVVTSIKRGSKEIFAHLNNYELQLGDFIRVAGDKEALANLANEQWLEKVSNEFRTDHLFLVKLPQNSKLDGVSLSQARFGELVGFNALAVIRKDSSLFGLSGKELLRSEDLIIVSGDLEEVANLSKLGDLQLEETQTIYPEETKDMIMAELLLSPRSNAIGRTLVDVNFREKYDYQVLALWHGGKPKRSNLATRKLSLGDALLVHGPISKLNVLKDDSDFVLLNTNIEQYSFSWTQSIIAIIAFLFITIASVFNIWPVHIVSLIGALLVLLSGALRLEDVYREVNWKIVIIISALLPFGTAFINSGLADRMSSWLIDIISDKNYWLGIIIVSLLTSALSQALDSIIAVLLIAPVAIQISNKMHGDPQLMLMAVAISASIAFITPFSHKANLIVMGAGGYRVTDYTRLGLPLTILSFLTLWSVLYFM